MQSYGIATIVFVSLIVVACAGVRQSSSSAAGNRIDAVIWQDKDQFVRLEPQDVTASPLNDHPVEMAPERIAQMLAVLEADLNEGGILSLRDKRETAVVFSNNELDTLGRNMATALAQASPQQDVTFHTIGRLPALGDLIEGLRVNTGRAFYRDGKLNVIFGEIRSKYRKKNIYGQRTDFKPRVHGFRAVAAEHDWRILTPPGIELHVGADGERDDWVLLDSVALHTGDGAYANGPTVDANTAATSPPDLDMEQRLKILKDLRDKGLITEEAYRAKVEKILEEL